MSKRAFLLTGFAIAIASVLVSSVMVELRQSAESGHASRVEVLMLARQRASGMMLEAGAKLDSMTLMFVAKKTGASDGLDEHLGTYLADGISRALELQCLSGRILVGVLDAAGAGSAEKACRVDVATHKGVVAAFLRPAGGSPRRYGELNEIASGYRRAFEAADAGALDALTQSAGQRDAAASSMSLWRTAGTALTVLGIMLAFLKDLGD